MILVAVRGLPLRSVPQDGLALNLRVHRPSDAETEGLLDAAVGFTKLTPRSKHHVQL